MGIVLAKAAFTDLAIQWGMFILAALFRTEKFWFMTGSATFIVTVQSLFETGKLFPRQVHECSILHDVHCVNSQSFQRNLWYRVVVCSCTKSSHGYRVWYTGSCTAMVRALAVR